MDDSLSSGSTPPADLHGPMIGTARYPFTAVSMAIDGRCIAVRRAMCSGPRVGSPVPAQTPRARADHRPMVIGLVFLLCLASVPLAGGRIGALAELRFRARGVLFASILAQI